MLKMFPCQCFADAQTQTYAPTKGPYEVDSVNLDKRVFRDKFRQVRVGGGATNVNKRDAAARLHTA